jgi:hypothetical protein
MVKCDVEKRTLKLYSWAPSQLQVRSSLKGPVGLASESGLSRDRGNRKVYSCGSRARVQRYSNERDANEGFSRRRRMIKPSIPASSGMRRHPLLKDGNVKISSEIVKNVAEPHSLSCQIVE